MLNSFKGLSGDNAIMDLISASYFGNESQNDHDPSQMFMQPSLDVYPPMSEDLPPGLLLSHMHQSATKPQTSPKKDGNFANGTQNGPKPSLLGLRTDLDMLGEDGLGDDDENSDNDGDSETDSAKKRGKYRTYTDEEKAHIINLMMKHGIQKTLEIFSNGEHKITKRKLKSWLESQGKVKGVKGRKSNDPARDRALHEWCMDFQNEHGRPPSRKEATQKALELSGDPNFQASKGWLDKFSRKYNLEFTPLKIIPPRGKKKTTPESEPVSAASASTAESALLGSLSPFKDAKGKQGDANGKKNKMSFKKDERNQESLLKMNPLFGLNKHIPQQIPMSQQAPQQTLSQPQPNPQIQQQQASPQPSQPQQQASQMQMFPQIPLGNMDGALPPIDPRLYQAFSSSLDNNRPQNFPYPLRYPNEYQMSYPMNYSKMYPVACGKPYPYQMNLPVNYQMGLENFQRLQQMMKKDGDNINEKPN